MSTATETALITGGTGFIGSHLVAHLLDEKWKVHVIVRPTSDLRALPPQVTGVHTYDGSIQSLLEAVRIVQPNVVFHLAALSIAQHTPHQVTPLIESNILFGVHLAEAITQQAPSCRFINAGSYWQHYQGKTYSPTNLYAATKQAFEDILIYYVEVCSLRALTLVLFDTYGPGDARPRLLNLLRKALRTGEPLALSPGEQELDLVHVDDVVRAFVQAARWLQTEAATGYVRFFVSSGRLIRLRDLVALCEQIAGRSIPVIWGGRPYRVREVMRPLQGGPPLPGWQPQIPLESGISQVFSQD